MKHILQHPARLVTTLLVAGTIGLLLLMHVHSSRDESACASKAPGTGIMKLI